MPRAGENPDLDQAAGSRRIIEEAYRRCSSQGRWALKEMRSKKGSNIVKILEKK